jgi:hypothetical protein
LETERNAKTRLESGGNRWDLFPGRSTGKAALRIAAAIPHAPVALPLSTSVEQGRERRYTFEAHARRHNVALIKFKPMRTSYNVALFFDRPIVDWVGVVPRFFDMIFRTVGAKIPVNAKEFFAASHANLGEINGRYNVYGGPSSFILYADRLAADFPSLLPGDYPLVRDLLSTVHDAFAETFPNTVVKTLESNNGEHLEILPPASVEAFLAPHRLPGVDDAFKAEAINRPGLKFTLKGAARAWQYGVLIEQSLLHVGALFAHYNLKIEDLTHLQTFEEKIAFGSRIEQMTFNALGLERADGA